MKYKLRTPEAIEIGKNIRKVRQIRGYNQEGLACKLDITPVSLSKIENGITNISLTRLFNIADALGVKIEVLLTDPCNFFD